MTTCWDLSRMIYTVRKLTGKFDTTQLPDQGPGPGLVSVENPPGVVDYINDFYLYDMPEHMRLLRLEQYFNFTTLPNVGTYNLPQNIVQVFPPIYVDNYQFSFYESPEQYYQLWPQLSYINDAVAQGNNTVGPYTFTVTATPVQQGTVVIGVNPNLDGNPSPQLETFTDQDTPGLLDQPLQMRFTNPGILTGNLGGTGTIDYLTGAVTITFANALPIGTNVNAHYHPYVAARPRDILFYQNQLFLRPIPDDAYAVRLLSYIQPVAALSALSNAATASQFDINTLTMVPLFNEWWQVLTYGAALKILIEEGDHQEIERLKLYFEEAKVLAQRRTLKELGSQRIPTVYSATSQNNTSWPIYPTY